MEESGIKMFAREIAAFPVALLPKSKYPASRFAKGYLQSVFSAENRARGFTVPPSPLLHFKIMDFFIGFKQN